MTLHKCFVVQLQSPDASPPMQVAALRTLSYGLKTLGEVNFTLYWSEMLPIITFVL